MSVGFCTVVRFSEPQTVSQKLIGFFDSYLSLGCLGCKRVEALHGFAKDGKIAVVDDSSRSSCLATALKIVSYLTVIIPLLALIAKITLRCCAYSFYLLDPKEAGEKVLRKVEAWKPLSDMDLRFLPLSSMPEYLIDSIFDLDVLPAELDNLRKRFALIPASEVAEKVYKGIEQHALLISESQRNALKISNSENVINAIYISCISKENIDPECELNNLKLKNRDGIVERMQLKMANLDCADLESAILKFWKGSNYYHFLTNEQLKKLKIEKFDKKIVGDLLCGLCRQPEMIHGKKLTLEIIEKNLSAIKQRFDLLDRNGLESVVQKDSKSKKMFNSLVSDFSTSNFVALVNFLRS